VYLYVPSDSHMNTEQKYPVTLYNAEGLCSLSQEMNSHGFYVTFVLMAE